MPSSAAHSLWESPQPRAMATRSAAAAVAVGWAPVIW